MNDGEPKAHQAKASWPARAGQLIAFYTAYVIFGLLGVITSLGCFPLALIFRSPGAHRLGQKLIHCLFRFFIWYLRSCRIANLEASDLNSLRHSSNLILVANHPSLLDAIFVVSKLPNIFCLMKADLARNIVLCGQSMLAGYIHNQSGVGLIKACQRRIREGSNLLVFPEGTRSDGQLGPFKMGFALVARAARSPIQTIVIRYNHDFLGKGWPFLHPPPLPIHCSMVLGKRFHPASDIDAQTLGQEVEDYLRATLKVEDRSTLLRPT